MTSPDPSARTVGVEEEFLLVRPAGTSLRAVGDAVADGAQADPGGASTGPESRFEHELKREQAELGSTPTTSLAELERDLRARRATLVRSAARHDARLIASGTSPLDGDATTTADDRYRRLTESFGAVATVQLTCGMHVHVSVSTPEEGVAVLDRIRPWLSVLLALSANSPWWQGVDTGYDSYRTVVWGQWPTAGPGEPFGDLAGYDRVRRQLLATGAALDDGGVYFDARLSARYPTVEIRVADVCARVEDAVTIAALARALVTTAAADHHAGRPPVEVGSRLLRATTWRAARFGVRDELVDPRQGATVRAWDLVGDVVALTQAALAATGDADRVEAGLAAIRERGTGADLQRRAFARAATFDAVVDAVAVTS